jgi:hypothetical protein
MQKEMAWAGQSSTSVTTPTSIPATTSARPATPAQLLTESRLRVFRRCQREHHYRYERGMVPLGSAALHLGTLVRTALQAWWGAAGGEERLAAALAAFATLAPAELDPFERVRAEEMVRGYHARWRDEPYETVAVAVEFRAPLRNPGTQAPSRTFARAGKLDVLAVHTRTRETIIIEHQVSGDDIRPGAPYWIRRELDGRASSCFRGADALGHFAMACVYDVVGKPRLRPYHATPIERRRFTKDGRLDARQRACDETPEEFRARVRDEIAADPECYFQRAPVKRREGRLVEHDYDAWNEGQLIREGRLTRRAPRNADACTRFASTCAYYDVCRGLASLDDPTRYRQLSWPHPELTEEVDHG